MKIIKKIDLKNHFRLLGLAVAVNEMMLLSQLAKENADSAPEGVLQSIDGICSAMQMKFWDNFSELYPKYSNNKMQIGGNSKTVEVIVYNEKREGREDCECEGGETASLDDIMEQAGVQNADDLGRA